MVWRLNTLSCEINNQPKEVLDYQTPFSVYFGRNKNASADAIREKVANASNRVTKRIFVCLLNKKQLPIYQIGDKVLVRYHFGKSVPYKRYITSRTLQEKKKKKG